MQKHSLRSGSKPAAAPIRDTAQHCIDVGPALQRSAVGDLHGRPYPVQFRSQGAVQAWEDALGGTEVWTRWQRAQTTCWAIRQELLHQLAGMDPLSLIAHEERERAMQSHQSMAVQISANMKYHVNKGTVIEATPALETLLTHSDVEPNLPMSMVAPPYAAQYVRFGETAMQHLAVPGAGDSGRLFDGVFFFVTPIPLGEQTAQARWALELIFILKRRNRYGGHISLLGETERGNTTVGTWLDQVLQAASGPTCEGFNQPMHSVVSYVVKLFLYMGLKQARVIEHLDYDEAMRRAAGLRERKRGKLLQRAASLYNGIVVGPESLPSATGETRTANGVAPHWRRGHFRMQAFGAGRQERKLIFVAPVLIHADQLDGAVPAPRPYRAQAPIGQTCL